MTASTATSVIGAPRYQGDDKLTLGIVLAVVTFWLFAQTTLNVAPAMRSDLHIAEGVSNIAVSITALFSGIFIVVAGGLADRLGGVRLTYAGLVLSILGSLLIALSPAGTAMWPAYKLCAMDDGYARPVRRHGDLPTDGQRYEETSSY